MSPREVIARAIAGLSDFEWDNSVFTVRADARRAADAVIDALAKMPVTDAMQEAAFKWEGSDDHVAVLWRAMVGAMRDE